MKSIPDTHLKSIPDTWVHALKLVHPQSNLDPHDAALLVNQSLNSTGTADYAFGQQTIATVLSSDNMDVATQRTQIEAAAGTDYLPTESKTKETNRLVERSTTELLNKAIATAKQRSLPPTVFDDYEHLQQVAAVSVLEVEE